MKPRVKAIYVSVQDMDRAVQFYESVFDTDVSSKNDKMSSFDFSDISFLLFNTDSSNESVIRGNNVVPNIEVENIEEIENIMKRFDCEVIMPPTKIEEYLVFQVRDTEGNIIEFYKIND